MIGVKLILKNQKLNNSYQRKEKMSVSDKRIAPQWSFTGRTLKNFNEVLDLKELDKNESIFIEVKSRLLEFLKDGKIWHNKD